MGKWYLAWCSGFCHSTLLGRDASVPRALFRLLSRHQWCSVSLFSLLLRWPLTSTASPHPAAGNGQHKNPQGVGEWAAAVGMCARVRLWLKHCLRRASPSALLAHLLGTPHSQHMFLSTARPLPRCSCGHCEQSHLCRREDCYESSGKRAVATATGVVLVSTSSWLRVQLRAAGWAPCWQCAVVGCCLLPLLPVGASPWWRRTCIQQGLLQHPLHGAQVGELPVGLRAWRQQQEQCQHVRRCGGGRFP